MLTDDLLVNPRYRKIDAFLVTTLRPRADSMTDADECALFSISRVLLGQDGSSVAGTSIGCHFRLVVTEVYRQIPNAADLVYLVAVNRVSGASQLLFERPQSWNCEHARTRRMYREVEEKFPAIAQDVIRKRNFLNTKKATHTYMLENEQYDLFMYRKMVIDAVSLRTGWALESVFRRLARLQQKNSQRRSGAPQPLRFAAVCDGMTLIQLIDRCDRLCHFCQSPNAKLRCSKCERAIYCSKECQILHWRIDNHKNFCEDKPNTRTVSSSPAFVLDMFRAFEVFI